MTKMLAALTALSLSTTAFAGSWTLDPTHSKVGFRVSHMMVSSVEGQFHGVEATLEMDGTDRSTLEVAVTIDTTTVDTANADRDAHLQQADFLDTATFPQMTFRSTGVKKAKKDTFVLVGDLTLRGVTKEVELTTTGLAQVVTDPWGNQRVGARAVGVIDRQDFGVSFNQALDVGVLVGDEVTLQLDVEFIQKP